MKETFVTIDQAQALKRLGFDWECDHYYAIGEHDWYLLTTEGRIPANFNKDVGECLIDCSAPALHVAAKWLREVKQYEVNAFRCMHRNQWDAYSYPMEAPALSALGILDDAYEKYEEALSAGITIALKLLEGKI